MINNAAIGNKTVFFILYACLKQQTTGVHIKVTFQNVEFYVRDNFVGWLVFEYKKYLVRKTHYGKK